MQVRGAVSLELSPVPDPELLVHLVSCAEVDRAVIVGVGIGDEPHNRWGWGGRWCDWIINATST